jgi:hypothetical protein
MSNKNTTSQKKIAEEIKKLYTSIPFMAFSPAFSKEQNGASPADKGTVLGNFKGLWIHFMSELW